MTHIELKSPIQDEPIINVSDDLLELFYISYHLGNWEGRVTFENYVKIRMLDYEICYRDRVGVDQYLKPDKE